MRGTRSGWKRLRVSEFHDDVAIAVRVTESGADGGEATVVLDATVSDRWSVGFGANGGYTAALLANGVIQGGVELGADPADGWSLRTLTSHFLRPPTPGAAELVVTPVRLGRGLSVLDVALQRDGKKLAVGRGVIGRPRDVASPDHQWADRVMPDLPSPDSLPREEWENENFLRARYDTRYARGGVRAGGDDSVTEGWFRTADHASVDTLLAVAMSDGWMPAPMVRTGTDGLFASTVDLTTHLYHSFDEPIEGWVAAFNRSTYSADGYTDVDTELWSEDGRFLALARQLVMLLPLDPSLNLG